MFTGIIQGIGTIIDIQYNNNIANYIIKFPKNLITDLKIGDSVANDGCCLSVTKINNDNIHFDLIEETLKITSFQYAKIGDHVNLERALRYGYEVGGHIISGHIISIAEIIKIDKIYNSICMHFDIKNKKFLKYFFYKGFIAIDGMSLTISKIYKNCFCVELIPLTTLKTTIVHKNIGDFVNIEIDANTQSTVDTIERIYFKCSKESKLNQL
uniref:Riboflavin synthase n=1 Tax=Candidatus Aschnera chinzeii TaxID=1485666 RepID=A0AAT9G440_9ENTR|nr:MAG: riboflavin synthase subunit alpha [Candidatus Aschnera chinzeii]